MECKSVDCWFLSWSSNDMDHGGRQSNDRVGLLDRKDGGDSLCTRQRASWLFRRLMSVSICYVREELGCTAGEGVRCVVAGVSERQQRSVGVLCRMQRVWRCWDRGRRRLQAGRKRSREEKVDSYEGTAGAHGGTMGIKATKAKLQGPEISAG